MGLVGVIARHDRHNLPLLLAILIIIEAESAAYRSTGGLQTFAARRTNDRIALGPS